jgi:uncharacterized protein
MLALSAVLLVQALLRDQLPPSLARHLLLQAAAGVVTLMVFLLVQACRTRWKKNRSSFVVRMTVLVLLTLGYVAGALLAIHRAEGDDPRLLAMIVSGVCGVLLYFVGLFTMLPGERARGRVSSRRERSASSSSSSSASSSSSSSWSGGGGRSGGGGASGSW